LQKEKAMSIPEFFKNLAIDTWYKAIMYIGGVGLIASLFAEVKGITNGQAQLFSLAFFFFGIGEWKNHKTISWIKPTNVYTGGPALMSAKVRQPDAFGVGCIILGVFFAIIGVISLIITLIK
jgi:hypothetical protein